MEKLGPRRMGSRRVGPEGWGPKNFVRSGGGAVRERGVWQRGSREGEGGSHQNLFFSGPRLMHDFFWYFTQENQFFEPSRGVPLSDFLSLVDETVFGRKCTLD